MIKILMLKKILLYSIILFLIFMIGASFYMKNIYTPEIILKTALKKNELYDKRYILCQEAWVTGFDWVMIKDEENNKTYEFCNIIGIEPFSELNLRAEFLLAQNTFIFYITEKKIYYSEEMKIDILEYVVTGWDILYPVKHSDFIDFFSSKKYITLNDISKDKTN